MKIQHDPRHAARILALQKLFEDEFKSTNLEQICLSADTVEEENALKFTNNNLCEINDIIRFDKKLFKQIIKLVKATRNKTDKIITELAPERPVNEVSQIDLQILRIAIAEGFIEKITPFKVAIDEAIELAKEFGGTASSKFVNGVLGNLLTKKEQFNL